MSTINRKFGVEVEFVGATQEAVADALNAAGVNCHTEEYNHTTRASRWKIVRDGSVHGPIGSGELVSPPTTDLAMVERALRAAAGAGATANRTCGLHVHVDMAGSDLDVWKRLVKLWCRYEDALLTAMPNSRATNSYCKRLVRTLRNTLGGPGPIDPSNLSDVFALVDGLTTLRELTDVRLACDRYLTLNPQSTWRYGTVEFRVHSGTTNASKVRRWVRLCQAIVAMAFDTTLVVRPCKADLPALFNEVESWVARQPATATLPAAPQVTEYRPRGNGPVAIAWQVYNEVCGNAVVEPRSQASREARRTYDARVAALGINPNTANTCWGTFRQRTRDATATTTAPTVDVAELRSYYLERAEEFAA